MKKHKYVLGIQCPVCDQKIWSKYRHDFRYCECGYSMVDGGRDYLHYGGGLPLPKNYTKEDMEIMMEFNNAFGFPKKVKIRVYLNDII